MDEAKKAEVREWAKKRYRRAMIFLPLLGLLCIGEWGFSVWAADGDHDNRAEFELSHVSSTVWGEFARFYMQQCQKLIAYPPPPQGTSEAEWAARIEQHFDQPTAVFRMNGSDIRWARMPETFRADSARLDQSVRVEENTENRGKRWHHDVGDMELLQWNVPAKLSDYTVWMAGPKSGHERWGSVRSAEGYLDPMPRELQRGDTVGDMDSPAYTLRSVVELSAQDKQNSGPGLRIIRNGVVVFNSPGLDTTQYCYSSGSPGLTVKLYESKMDHQWARLDRFRFRFGYLVCGLLILAFPVAIRRWYKKVMLLTEPEDRSE